MKLLFITQKLHGQDAFTVLWIEAFMRLGYDVTVLCLEWRPEDAQKALGRKEDFSFVVHSLGKERGTGKAGQVAGFMRAVATLQYDRVFIHMTPVWGIFGAPAWLLRRTPVYLWYTHYKMQSGLWLLGRYARRLFCATTQSMPQFEGSSKKVVVGHGVDLSFWPRRENHAPDAHKLLAVHRLSRSKRLEINLRALALLPGYTLDIYGIDAEPDYAAEMRALTVELGLADRVSFKGSAPATELADIYASYRLILNMASETIDKTMLEAMTCGCYPVTTTRNAQSIGIPAAPDADTPEAVAAFVRTYAEATPINAEEMYQKVEERHSLDSLVKKMDSYIRSGT